MDDALRVLIGPPGSLERCVLSFPLLCALRDSFPRAFLVWSVDRRFMPLVRGHVALDRMLVLPDRWQTSLQKIRWLRHQLRSLEIDLALDPQGTGISRIIVWLSGAERRVSWSRRGAKNRVTHGELPQSALEASPLALLQALGISPPRVRFSIPRQAAAEAKVEALIEATHLSGGFAMIYPPAEGEPWPPQRYGAVARHLGQRHRLSTVISSGGPPSDEVAARIMASSGGHALVAPGTSWPEIVSLMTRAELFLSSDRGWCYLAAAVGTPGICLGPVLGSDLSDLFGAAIRGVGGPDDGHRWRGDAPGKLWDITTESVCTECERILDDAGFRAAPAA